jgi:hypothetical protein
MRQRGNTNRILMGKLVERQPLERRRRRWEDNIKTDVREALGVLRAPCSWNLRRMVTNGGLWYWMSESSGSISTVSLITNMEAVRTYEVERNFSPFRLFYDDTADKSKWL